MATSNSQLIQDALGLIGVLAETETMTAEQGAHGLRTLNELMADWRQDGVDLQYFEQVSVADEVPLPQHAIIAVKYYLAMALAPFYERPVPAEFLTIGADKYARLKRDAVVQALHPSDMAHMHRGSGMRRADDFDFG